jgi:hypothetical protein
MNGPFPAGKPDIEVFRHPGGLKTKIPAGKKAIADNGYRGEKDVLVPQTPTTQRIYVSSKAALEPAMNLLIADSRTFGASASDSATVLRSTKLFLRRFVSFANTRWRMDPLCLKLNFSACLA